MHFYNLLYLIIVIMNVILVFLILKKIIIKHLLQQMMNLLSLINNLHFALSNTFNASSITTIAALN